MPSFIHFHGDLPTLLRRRWQGPQPLPHNSERAASIKDVVEAFGVPHTEVGALEVDTIEVDFSHPIDHPCRIEVWPQAAPWRVAEPCLLRPTPLPRLAFVADVNVSKLGRLLRMAGFDVAADPGLSDAELAWLSAREERLLLTKDRGLLRRKVVQFGRAIRATDPLDQLREVIELLAIHDRIRPFSRCLACNTPLTPVAKGEIVHLLEPLTKKYYSTFSRCPGCAKIYWSGSHVEKMQDMLAKAQ